MAAQPAQPNVHQLYKRLETVGKGAYGSVHKGIEIATGNVVALKIINLDTADDDVADIQREVALLTHLRDAVNITKYYGCYLDGPRVWIVMEYAQGGSVRTLMKACKNNVLQEKYIVIITRELLLALASLHKAGVIHRDIKAANILITAAGKVMLCDFGVSALLVTSQSKRNTLIGTPYWMAPEVAQPVPNYDTKADIWSLGITIYEMVTGSPPHSNLDGFKVVQLIPRSKPPRLAESEGSKELRDFVASCLRESPAERPTAEELSKTKWIKATAKTPVSILKELLVQYEQWQQAGGTRASIADPLPWEEEEEEDMRSERSTGHEQETWEFDTVRARSMVGTGASTENPDGHRSPPLNARVPSSLRGLFGEDTNTPNLPFAWSRNNTPTPPLGSSLLAQSPLSASTQSGPSRGRPTPRRGVTTDDRAGEETARQANFQANFVFPPRPTAAAARAKSKLSSSVPSSDNESGPSSSPERTARLLPLGPGHGHGPSQGQGRGIGDTTMNNGGSTLRPSPSYREVRNSRGVPNISIPPANLRGGLGMSVDSTSSSGHPATDDSLSHESPSKTTRPLFGRKRSQSSAATSTPSSSSPVRHRNAAFTHDFHFPPVSATANLSGPSLPLPVVPPSRASNSSNGSGSEPGRSPSAHHTTYSLDAYRDRDREPTSAGLAGIGRNFVAGGLDLPPSISRAHSANALSESIPSPAMAATGASQQASVSRRMSIARQASVAVMESVRSPGSGASVGASPERDRNVEVTPVPGLKDVLKVPSVTSEMRLGMTDLLPPSPSAASANRRFFTPAPSSLSSSVTPGNVSSSGAESIGTNTSTSTSTNQRSPSFPQTRTAPSSPSMPSSVPNSRPNGPGLPPSPAERQATDTSVSTTSSTTTATTTTYLSTSTGSRTTHHHRHNHSHDASSSASSIASVASIASAAGILGIGSSPSPGGITGGTGPPVRPLDLAPLMASHEATHAALSRTVDELVQWLGVVEVGLSAVLERTAPGAAPPVSGTDDTFLEHDQYAVPAAVTAATADDNINIASANSDAFNFTAFPAVEDDEELAAISPEAEAGDADAGDVEGTVGTFEQFLAKVRKHEQELGEDGEDGGLPSHQIGMNILSSSNNGLTPEKDKFSFPSHLHSHSNSNTNANMNEPLTHAVRVT